MFNSKEPIKIINKYTSPFIIGGIMVLVFGVLMVVAINFPTNYVNNESKYCISVDVDSGLTDTITYKVDSIADIKMVEISFSIICCLYCVYILKY